MIEPNQLAAVEDFAARVNERANLQISETGRTEGAHLTAMTRELASLRLTFQREEPKRMQAMADAAAKEAGGREAAGQKLAAERKAWQAEKALQLKEINDMKSQLGIDRSEVERERQDLISREARVDLADKGAFDRELLSRGDVIQINPEWITRPNLRACFGVVTEVKPDGTPRFYIQAVGDNDKVMGTIHWGLINSKWCKKIGRAEWMLSSNPSYGRL